MQHSGLDLFHIRSANYHNMKFSFKNIKKIKTYMVRLSKKPTNPAQHWYVLLLVATALLALSAMLNLLTFFEVYRGEPISNETEKNPPARETQQTEDRLLRVENIFSERSTQFETILSDPYQFVDPARK